VPARRPGDGELTIIEDAPGTYVKMRVDSGTAPPEPKPLYGDAEISADVSDEHMAEFTRIIAERPPPTRRPRARQRAIDDASRSQAPGDGSPVTPAFITPSAGDEISGEISDERMAAVRHIISERPTPIVRSGAGRRKARRFPADLCG
jgi:hypothetical protein